MRIGYGTSVTVPTQAERWFSELRAGRAFSRGQALVASVGNFSEIQIFNPAGSGVSVIVYKINVSCSVADFTRVHVFNTALGALVGTGINLLSGGAAAVAELRTAQPAAQDGTFVSTIDAAATSPFERISVWAWELGAGEGVLIATGSVNRSLCTEFYWNEA
jgi:hypothetical protein